ERAGGLRGREPRAGPGRPAPAAPRRRRPLLDDALLAHARRLLLAPDARLRPRALARGRPARGDRGQPRDDPSLVACGRGRVGGGGARRAEGIRYSRLARDLVRARAPRPQLRALPARRLPRAPAPRLLPATEPRARGARAGFLTVRVSFIVPAYNEAKT